MLLNLSDVFSSQIKELRKDIDIEMDVFDDGIETIKAEHHIDNIASGRVMEKCGMNFTHNDKAQRKFGSAETCDVKCYEIRK